MSKQKQDALRPILFKSALIQECMDRSQLVARTDVPVLLLGETGVGKENFANWIYQQSERSEQSFVVVCAPTISATLAASELFGHERGSFTGAVNRHIGAFERANGGTLFIDEITEIPHELQAMLLRVLQEGEIMRVGSGKPIPVDVRIISATNRDPEDAIRKGMLRPDLYFRLQGMEVRIPPLRDRLEDVPVLAAHFAKLVAEKYNLPNPRFTQSAAEILLSYKWPGNVRELANVVSESVIVASNGQKGVITSKQLPTKLQSIKVPRTVSKGILAEAVKELERAIICNSEEQEPADRSVDTEGAETAVAPPPALESQGPSEPVDQQPVSFLESLEALKTETSVTVEKRAQALSGFRMFFFGFKTKLAFSQSLVKQLEAGALPEAPKLKVNTVMTGMNGVIRPSHSLAALMRASYAHKVGGDAERLEIYDRAFDTVYNLYPASPSQQPPGAGSKIAGRQPA